MPATPYQRLQVVTIPPVRAALERISAVTGDRMGSIVREYLEAALPGLEAMADALEMVPKNPGEALARMSRTLSDAVGDAQQQGLFLDEKRTELQKAVRKHKAAKRAAAKRDSSKPAIRGRNAK